MPWLRAYLDETILLNFIDYIDNYEDHIIVMLLENIASNKFQDHGSEIILD